MSVLINIFGPSTAGKSTTTELLQHRLPDAVVVDFDLIKRQILDYHWKLHGQQGRDMTLAELNRVAATGSPIILLYPAPRDGSEYQKIVAIAEDNDYVIHNT